MAKLKCILNILVYNCNMNTITLNVNEQSETNNCTILLQPLILALGDLTLSSSLILNAIVLTGVEVDSDIV